MKCGSSGTPDTQHLLRRFQRQLRFLSKSSWTWILPGVDSIGVNSGCNEVWRGYLVYNWQHPWMIPLVSTQHLLLLATVAWMVLFQTISTSPVSFIVLVQELAMSPLISMENSCRDCGEMIKSHLPFRIMWKLAITSIMLGRGSQPETRWRLENPLRTHSLKFRGWTSSTVVLPKPGCMD